MDTLLDLIETTIKGYLKTQAYEDSLMAAKAVAISFIVFNFISRYVKNLDDSKFSGFKFSDFIDPCAYIAGICFFTTGLSLFESFTHSFFQEIENGKPMYQSLIQAQKDYAEIQQKKSETILGIVMPTPSMIINDVMITLSRILCWILGVIDIAIYSVFIAERHFLLGVTNLLFPFLLAFSALHLFKDYVKKGIRIYLGIVVSIYVIGLSMNVGQRLFEKIKELLSGTKKILEGDLIPIGDLGDFLSILIAGFIAIVIKRKLINAGINHIIALLR